MNTLLRTYSISSIVAVWLLTGCAGQGGVDKAQDSEGRAGSAVSGESSQLRGVLVGLPTPKPDFTLTTVDGTSFDFGRDTEGFLTLLFFGYTHCPDVCPVHMANIGRVLNGLPSEITSRVRVVFVTTDPERDTDERLREWLGNFHREFIGLTGTPQEIAEAQHAAGVFPAARESTDSTNPSTYFVSHAAQVTAYTSDNRAHIIYPFGIRQQDWANDIPILVNGWPE